MRNKHFRANDFDEYLSIYPVFTPKICEKHPQASDERIRGKYVLKNYTHVAVIYQQGVCNLSVIYQVIYGN